MSDNPAGWQADPTGKHDHRYWDGTGWTDHVADAGVAGTDPYEEVATPPAEEAPAADDAAAVDEVPAAEEAEPAVDDGSPTDEASPDGEATDGEAPTVITPVATGDDTTSYPIAGAPADYAPPSPAPTGGTAGGDDGKRKLLIGGGILAAVVLAVLAFVAFGGDDDDTPASSDQTTTTEASDTTDTTDGGPETVEDLQAACADGDFAACDNLYFSAELGSDLEEFGSTCGGIAPPQNGNCEVTDGGDASGVGDIIAGTLQEQLGLDEEQATCLADTFTEAIREGEITQEQAMTNFFDYLSECDISLEDINGG